MDGFGFLLFGYAMPFLDDQHRIVRANRPMAERLGVTTEQCIGLHCYEAVHGTAQPPEFCPHAQTCRDGREHTAEVHEPRLGGHFLVTTTPRFDEQGRLIGAAHVARDITARKRGEENARSRWGSFAYAVRLWLPKEFSRAQGVPSHKLTELAAKMLRQLALPGKGKVIALFDAYYLCPVVVQTCEARGWAYISVAKKNRNFFPQGRDRDKRKLSRYGRNVLRRDGRVMNVGGKRHRVAERAGRLSKVGEVKLVFSRRAGDRAWVVLVTNRRQWSAKTVLSHYQQRWGIEVLFKMAKQHLGLGDYQFLRYRAIENYLRLVLLAYLLLTHQALRAPDVQAELKKRHHVLRLASIPQLQQRLRTAVWDDLVQRLENRPKQRVVARKIKELLQNCS